MGLDMYARTLRNRPNQVVDFHEPGEGVEEIFYWRKHPDLHGWMERLYREKGGEAEDFNLATVILDLEDLERLEAVVRCEQLPHTEGFFFGHSEPGDAESDLNFIAAARKAIAEGLTVYYKAWW